MFRRNAILWLLFWLLCLPAWGQDPRLDYQAGLEKFEKSRMREAAEAFSRAVASQPREEKTFWISGNHYVVYVPHLYLGLALEKLGDFKRARAELLESRRQQVSTSIPDLNRRLAESLKRIDDAMRTSAPDVVPTPSNGEAGAAAVTTAGPSRGPDRQLSPTATTALPTPGAGLRLTTTPSAWQKPAAFEQARLREGLRDFFSSRYETAAQELAPLSQAGHETARLFTAYALCGLYLSGGGRDSDIIQRARALYKKLPARLLQSPKPGVSPRLIAELER